MRKIKDRFVARYSGFSMLEILIALSLFTIVVSAVAVFSIDSVAFIASQKISIEANNQMDQMLDAVKDFKSYSWDDFIAHTGGSSKNFDIPAASGSGLTTFSVIDGSVERDGVTSYFSIEDVYRDDNDNIVETGGLLDPNSRKLTVFASWTDGKGNPQTDSVVTYVNNWEVERWRNTLEAEWVLGAFSNTVATNDVDGEVVLDVNQDFLPNWCNPALSTSYHNIPGSGYTYSVSADESNGRIVYLATGKNASGKTFSKLELTGTTNDMTLTEVGVWDSGKAQHVWGEGDFAYLSKDDNSKELYILDHSSYPFTQEGYVDAPTSVDAEFSTRDGNVGYIAQARVLISYDLTSTSGSRAILDTVSVGGSSTIINTIAVYGGYAFLSVSSDSDEVIVVDVSDPYNMAQVNGKSVNNLNALEMVVSADGQTAFLLTNWHEDYDEFWLLDISNPIGTINVLASLDLGGYTQTFALAVVEEDNVILISGDAEDVDNNYRVYTYDLDTYDIVECGGLHIEQDIIDIDPAKIWIPERGDYNYYTYSAVDDSSREFQIVRGDEGDVGGQGYGFYPDGTFTSLVLDTNSTTTNYDYFRWSEVLPTGADILFQVRAHANATTLLTEDWIGPDGTTNTFFTDNTYSVFPSSVDGKQYLQFRAYLSTTNPDVTPELHKLDIFFTE